MKDTSAWSNKKESLASERGVVEGIKASLAEVDEQGLATRSTAAATAREAAQATADACAPPTANAPIRYTWESLRHVMNGRRCTYCSQILEFGSRPAQYIQPQGRETDT